MFNDDMNQNNHENNQENQVPEQEVQQEQNNCNAELNEAKSRILLLVAEFDNYKKRTEKERTHWMAESQADVLKNVIEVNDDVERALSEIEREDLPEELLAHLAGVKLIAKSFNKIIEKYQVKEIPADVFDPELHEALVQVESDKHESGQVVSVLQKGYTYKGKTLRPAKVTVAK